MSGPRSAGGASSARLRPQPEPDLGLPTRGASAGTHEIVVTDPSTRTSTSSSLTGVRHVGRHVARRANHAPAVAHAFGVPDPRASVAGVNPVRRTRIVADGVRGRLALIGADPADDEETRQRKALLVLVSVLILPIPGVGGPLPGTRLAGRARSRTCTSRCRWRAADLRPHPRCAVLLRVQAAGHPAGADGVDDLRGRLPRAGAVGLWGLMAPMGALVFGDVRSAIRWFVAFLAVFVVSGILGELLWHSPAPAGWFTTTMLVLNVVVGGRGGVHAAGPVRPAAPRRADASGASRRGRRSSW